MRRILIAAAGVAAFSVAACGGSSSPSSASPSATPASPSATAAAAGAATVRLVDFSLQPATLSVAVGTTIRVVNDGKSPHNFWIRNQAGTVLAKTDNLQPGQSSSLRLDLPAGSYTDYCQEPGHESLGMKGTLTIS